MFSATPKFLVRDNFLTGDHCHCPTLQMLFYDIWKLLFAPVSRVAL